MGIPPNIDTWNKTVGAEIVGNSFVLSALVPEGADTYDEFLDYGHAFVWRYQNDPSSYMPMGSGFEAAIKLAPPVGEQITELKTQVYLANQRFGPKSGIWNNLKFETSLGSTAITCSYTEIDTPPVILGSIPYDPVETPWLRFYISDGVLRFQVGSDRLSWISVAEMPWTSSHEVTSAVLWVAYVPDVLTPRVNRDAKLVWSEYYLNGRPIFSEETTELPDGIYIGSSKGWVRLG